MRSHAQVLPTQPAPAAPAPQPTPAAAAAPVGEQVLDTNTNTNTTPNAKATTADPNTPILTTNHRNPSKVRTVADDNLPKWVPVRGRLTVVDSSDLAENLGLVPKGATKKSDERISVADKLAEENAARGAKTDPMTQGTSWSYTKPGRFRNHR